jgi:hypothetical protein
MIPKNLEVTDLRWRTSRRSAGNGACVEVAPAAGTVLVRDSQDQAGPIVQYPGGSWRTFLGAVKIGQFDLERL